VPFQDSKCALLLRTNPFVGESIGAGRFKKKQTYAWTGVQYTFPSTRKELENSKPDHTLF